MIAWHGKATIIGCSAAKHAKEKGLNQPSSYHTRRKLSLPDDPLIKRSSHTRNINEPFKRVSFGLDSSREKTKAAATKFRLGQSARDASTIRGSKSLGKSKEKMIREPVDWLRPIKIKYTTRELQRHRQHKGKAASGEQRHDPPACFCFSKHPKTEIGVGTSHNINTNFFSQIYI